MAGPEKHVHLGMFETFRPRDTTPHSPSSFTPNQFQVELARPIPPSHFTTGGRKKKIQTSSALPPFTDRHPPPTPALTKFVCVATNNRPHSYGLLTDLQLLRGYRGGLS